MLLIYSQLLKSKIKIKKSKFPIIDSCGYSLLSSYLFGCSIGNINVRIEVLLSNNSRWIYSEGSTFPSSYLSDFDFWIEALLHNQRLIHSFPTTES